LLQLLQLLKLRDVLQFSIIVLHLIFIELFIGTELILRLRLLLDRFRPDFTHVTELVIDALVNNVLAVNACKLVVVAVHDQGVHHQVFEPVVVALHDQVLEAPQAVAVSGREVTLGRHEVIMTVHCC